MATQVKKNQLELSGNINEVVLTDGATGVKSLPNGTTSQFLRGDGSWAVVPIPVEVPVGIIAMWSGSIVNIPSGWALCDGINGRPNMINRFIKGIASSSTNPTNTGGGNTVTLTTANIPSHTHTQQGTFSLASGSAASAGSHTHNALVHSIATRPGTGTRTFPLNPGPAGEYDEFPTIDLTPLAGEHTHTVSGSTTISGTVTATGNGTAITIPAPPYFEIAFIIKV